jgi:hypothetical protein
MKPWTRYIVVGSRSILVGAGLIVGLGWIASLAWEWLFPVAFVGVLAGASSMLHGFSLLRESRRRCSHGILLALGEPCAGCQADLEIRERQRQATEREASALALRRTEILRLREHFVAAAAEYGDLSPQEFENTVAALFRGLGFEVEQTPYTNDGGKDAYARKDGKLYLIECKKYGPGNAVGRRDLQILYAAMTEERAYGGYFVTTGRFARTTHEFAKGKRIQLIDQAGLVGLHAKLPVSSSLGNYAVQCSECGRVNHSELKATCRPVCTGCGAELRHVITTRDLR